MCLRVDTDEKGDKLISGLRAGGIVEILPRPLTKFREGEQNYGD
jgi:hypothetical protein